MMSAEFLWCQQEVLMVQKGASVVSAGSSYGRNCAVILSEFTFFLPLHFSI